VGVCGAVGRFGRRSALRCAARSVWLAARGSVCLPACLPASIKGAGAWLCAALLVIPLTIFFVIPLHFLLLSIAIGCVIV
jgi:hypothetical protein